jgi:hypothetical protein
MSTHRTLLGKADVERAAPSTRPAGRAEGAASKRWKFFDYAACFAASIKVESLLSAFELLIRLETAHLCK